MLSMKLAERKTRRHQNAPPHHRADPGQPEFDLEDRVCVRREVLCRNERLRPSFHAARLLPLSLSVAGHPRDPDALQIVDRVHAPIRAFAAGFADATAIRNPENAARPSKVRTRRLGPQHRRHDLREKLARLMQPIVERGVGQIRDPSQLRPSRRLPQRQAARTARQGQSQQRPRVRHAPPPPKRPRREREFVEVQIAQNMVDQARPVFDESRC